MLIFADRYQTLKGFPNQNWLEELDCEQPLYVVDDNSEIAKKIKQYKSFNLVTNDDGELVDVEQIKTINDFKKELADTDYKIIKCNEYQLTGLECPYDIQALHAERQAIRNKINAMEVEK